VVEPHDTERIGLSRVKSGVLAIEAGGLRELCEKGTPLGYCVVSQPARVIRRRLQAARF
jgi:hypothetical protein